MRVFQPVCIVFISPPGVYFSQYFACFVRVFVLFIDYTREETHADCQCSSILVGAGPSDT